MHTGNLEYYHLLEKEPYELRGSRTVLMGTQGEVPWVYLLSDCRQREQAGLRMDKNETHGVYPEHSENGVKPGKNADYP